jgi:hypothetical protein
VQRFGRRLSDYGVPIVTPVGGSAVYIRIDEFFADTKLPPDSFPGIALTALLLLLGHRFCELGHFAFGGSDFVMLFQDGVEFSLDVSTGEEGYEHVLTGERLGSLTKTGEPR